MKKLKEKFISFITKDRLAKIISLVVAILLWFYINYEQLPQKYFSVALIVKNIPKGMAIADPFNNMITIKIKGPKDTIQSINVKYLKAEMDLKNAAIGKNKFPVLVHLTKKYNRVRIASTEPEEININMDKLVLKELPVSITIINSPAEGYLKTGESFSPKTILVGGPVSLINTMEAVRTIPVDIGGVTGSIHKTVELDLPSEFITAYNYKRVTININIKKNYKMRFISQIPIIAKNLNSNLKIANQNDLIASVRLEGPPERLSLLEKEKDFLFINMADIIQEGSYSLRVEHKIPWNCKMRGIDPVELKIEVEGK
ncbi:MAG: hypothetical protein KKH98_01705 [Spirochaetes bacterium]|nr:hypothetical protein [Spirochaetota bacterium]